MLAATEVRRVGGLSRRELSGGPEREIKKDGWESIHNMMLRLMHIVLRYCEALPIVGEI